MHDAFGTFPPCKRIERTDREGERTFMLLLRGAASVEIHLLIPTQSFSENRR